MDIHTNRTLQLLFLFDVHLRVNLLTLHPEAPWDVFGTMSSSSSGKGPAHNLVHKYTNVPNVSKEYSKRRRSSSCYIAICAKSYG